MEIHDIKTGPAQSASAVQDPGLSEDTLAEAQLPGKGGYNAPQLNNGLPQSLQIHGALFGWVADNENGGLSMIFFTIIGSPESAHGLVIVISNVPVLPACQGNEPTSVFVMLEFGCAG